MATWGNPDVSGWESGTIATASARYFGGQWGEVEGVVNSLSIHFQNTSGGGLPFAAIYVGGTASNPEGAVLLEDFGQLPAITSPDWATKNSTSNPAIPPGSNVWIAVVGASSSNQLRALPARGDILGYSSDLNITGGGHQWSEVVPAGSGDAASGSTGVVIDYTEATAEPIVATKLTFSAQPGNTVVGQTMSAVQVAAVDDDDQLDTSFDGDVTIALQVGDGTQLGTLTKAAVGGLATFDDLSNRTLNEGAVLRATADGLTQVDSSTFDITAGGGGGTTGFPSSSRIGGLLQ